MCGASYVLHATFLIQKDLQIIAGCMLLYIIKMGRLLPDGIYEIIPSDLGDVIFGKECGFWYVKYNLYS